KQIPVKGGIMTTVAEGETDAAGHYRLSFRDTSAKTHSLSRLVVRKEGLGLGWSAVDLDAGRSQIDLKLVPQELVRVRLIDIQGQPAGKTDVFLISILPKRPKPDYENGVYLGQLQPHPRALPLRLTTDENGLLAIPHIPPGHGLYLKLAGDERFAPQEIGL